MSNTRADTAQEDKKHARLSRGPDVDEPRSINSIKTLKMIRLLSQIRRPLKSQSAASGLLKINIVYTSYNKLEMTSCCRLVIPAWGRR